MEPPHLPSSMKTRSPDGGRHREGGKTRFRITAPPWSSDSTWPCPMKTLRGTGEGNAAFSCRHGPSSTGRTHGRSSPSSYSQMLQSCPRTENVASASSSTERNRPGVNTHLNRMKSWSGVYKRRSWMRGIGNSEWDMIQHKCYAVLKGLVARSYRILCDLTSVACQHPLSLGFLK